jgi:hypothetical protein
MTNERMQAPRFSATNREIYHNAKVKLFPRVDLAKVTYCSRSIFKDPGWEAQDDRWKREDYGRAAMGANAHDDSIRRAKERVKEYAMLNPFEYFITWTLDPGKIDRYDQKEVAKRMQRFLKDKVRHNNLMYVIVPELHKDGAIHAHGFVSGDLKMVNSGKRDRAGRVIYNMKQWKLGFSTAIRIDGNYEKACYYITKYVEKKTKMIFGNFYYAGGHGLIRHPEKHLFDADYMDVEATEYHCNDFPISFKYEDQK